jgi:predicted ATPase
MSEEKSSNKAFAKGKEPSIIERFGIRNLYGYRSIEIESNYSATILIAKNGTGKTTLLGAMDAFLRLQFSRLRNLEFGQIECKIRGVPDKLVLTHDEVIEFLRAPTDAEFLKISNTSGIDPQKLFLFLLENPNLGYTSTLGHGDSEIYDSILKSANYNPKEVDDTFGRLRDALYQRQPNIAFIAKVVKDTLSGYEIVYLPTYRRVELALTDEERGPYSRRRRKPRFNVASGSLLTGEIQFGLSDISERLADLNQQIVIGSNDGYRKISAKIINDLISGDFESGDESGRRMPSQEELRLFFSRIEQGRKIGPYQFVSIPNIEKIYSENAVSESSSKFLRYFLSQLSTIIENSEALQAPVHGFIDNCNKYLTSSEPSTQRTANRDAAPPSMSGKKLQLRPRDLSVSVESIPERRKISLDALSSGEKQMISLFAKLYLYPRKKIVLIDEPELSLSIEWQMQILVDILNAPLCEQFIAITHSPFVFDNELEPFARSISVKSEMLAENSQAAASIEDQSDE